jgi:hypothetical protein
MHLLHHQSEVLLYCGGDRRLEDDEKVGFENSNLEC